MQSSSYPQQQQAVPPTGANNPYYPEYYNSYGLSPSQPPPHPDRSIQTGALDSSVDVDLAFAQRPPAEVAFASPPPPTWNEIHTELRPATHTSPSYNPAPTVDLLSEDLPVTSQPNPNEDFQTALRLAAEEEAEVRRSATHPPPIATTDDIPSDIVVSQQRALAQAKQRNQESHYNTVAAMGATGITEYASTSNSTALTVPLDVPTSANPTGSDAIHPSRPQWKNTRGSKTAAGAATGAIIGGVVFGPAFPVGMVLGGTAGGYAANKISKTGERRAQRKWEQNSYQRGTLQSPAIQRDAPLV